MKQKFRRLMEVKELKREDYVYEDDDIIQVKMVKMIYVLLQKASYVAGWRDANGLTPLHTAASLNTTINLDVITLIIVFCPPSMEVCDKSGKNILHHLVNRIMFVPQGEEFIRKTQLHGLRNRQDNMGNTPVHWAVYYEDFIMVQLLFNFNANNLIKNKEGVTPKALMEQKNMSQMLKTGVMMTKETCRKAELGDLLSINEYLKKGGKHFIKSYDSEGRNLLHKLFLIKYGHVIVPGMFLGFVEQVLDSIPQFLEEMDKNCDTPVHVLAQLNPEDIVIHLATGHSDGQISSGSMYPGSQPNAIFFNSSYQCFTYRWEVLGHTPFFTHLIECCLDRFSRGCLMRNKKGNTALHEAILANNYPVFVKLARLNIEATTLVNNSNETILHLLATHPMHSIEADLLDAIIRKNTNDNRELLDNEGLSPIMRAIQAGNIRFAKKLCSICPSMAKAQDSNGRTFWHLLVTESQIKSIESLGLLNSSFNEEGVCRQLETKDKKRMTPLHLAIECRCFDLARAFIELHGNLKSNGETLLKIPNSDGITPAEMLAGLAYVPPQFKDFIGKECAKQGIQSLWGISPTQIKDYVNTMGVIAALLTTVTFTAAFTVPGGSAEEEGTPLLLNDLAFQIFIISDILAMCLSMAVLFCLLWIMATDKKSKIKPLLDFSIILLRASFYLTLVTFIAGLWTTTYSIKSWVAIVALVLCLMLMLLMHKCVVKTCMIPCVETVLKILNEAIQCARRLCKNIVPKVKNWRQKSSSSLELPMYSNKSASD